MKVSTEQAANRQAIVEVELEPSELEQALERAYRRVVRTVAIHGFRPGKAPRRIVEQRLGRGILIEEAARELVPKVTSEVIEEQRLEAIAQPEVEITSFEPLSFKATISLRPTVQLGDYASVRVAPREVDVTESQIDEVITRLQEGRATWQLPSAARPAAAGDRVKIDLTSSIDGEPLDEPQRGLTAALTTDATASRQSDLIPELQQAIVGLNVGDSSEVTVNFPEDHGQETVRGKAVTFAVTLHEVRQKELPPIDDEFIKAVSDAGDLAELRERIRTNLETQARDGARAEVSRAALDLVSEQATIEMPPVLVENQIDAQLTERRQLFERQGIQWQRVLEITGQSEEQVREEMRAEAERRVRNSLVLIEMARAEQLSVTAEEVATEIGQLIESYPAEQRTRARQNFERLEARQTVENNLFERRIIDRLIELTTEGRGAAVGLGEGGLPLLQALAGPLPATDGEAAAGSGPGDGSEAAVADTSLRPFVDQAYETLTPAALAEAPIAALQGLSATDAAALEQALGIRTVADLANHRFVRWAQAIVDIADTAGPTA